VHQLSLPVRRAIVSVEIVKKKLTAGDGIVDSGCRCQIAAVAHAPIALFISAVDSHAAECSCRHGAGAMCPMLRTMHHKPAGGSSR
jgi:hypothetical protein